MNKYLYSVCDLEDYNNSIYTVVAKSTADAKDRIIQQFIEDFEWEDAPDEWEEFYEFAIDHGYSIGWPKDIETL